MPQFASQTALAVPEVREFDTWTLRCARRCGGNELTAAPRPDGWLSCPRCHQKLETVTVVTYHRWSGDCRHWPDRRCLRCYDRPTRSNFFADCPGRPLPIVVACSEGASP